MFSSIALGLVLGTPAVPGPAGTGTPVVVRVNLDGERLVELTAGLRVAEGLAPASRGTFWTTDAGHRRVVRLTPDGSRVESLGGHGLAPGSFLMPIDVVEGARRVSVLDRHGRRLVEWRRRARGRPSVLPPVPLDLGDPIALEVTPDDGLLVLDADSGRILHLDSERRRRSVIAEKGRGRCQLGCPHDLALRDDGTIFVADAGNRRIQRFGLDGACLGPVPWPRRARPLQDPTGVAVDASGRLLIADHYGHRLLRLSWTEDGEIALLEDFDLGPSLRYPTRLAVQPDGRVLTSSPQLSRIWLIELPAGPAAAAGGAGRP